MMIMVKAAVTAVLALKAAPQKIPVPMTVAIVSKTVAVSAAVPIPEVMITCSSNKGALETLGCPKATIMVIVIRCKAEDTNTT